jgi:hypothetical protein
MKRSAAPTLRVLIIGYRRTFLLLFPVLVICSFLISSPQSARADTTIISVSGPAANNALGIFPTDAIAVSFTVGQSYSNVTISADLIGNFTGTVYLTNQIGPGTTAAANQIATATFTSSNPGITLVGTLQPVMTGVTLQPGTYYLVFTGVSAFSGFAQGIQNTLSPTITADVGASQDGFVYYTNSPSGYIPADSFLKSAPAGTGVLEYAVTVLTSTPPGCGVTLAPSGQSFGAGGGLGSFAVTTGANCNWNAFSNSSWITLLPGFYACPIAVGILPQCPPPPSSGTVRFVVASNSGPGRAGSITVGNQNFNIDQQGLGPTCTYTVSPPRGAIPSGGGALSVQAVANGTNCQWTAVSAATWLTVSPGTGSGNASITLRAGSNTTGIARTGVVTISGQTVLVTQPSTGGAAICGAVDVSNEVRAIQSGFTPDFLSGTLSSQTLSLTNISTSTVSGPLFVAMIGEPVLSPLGPDFTSGLTSGPGATYCFSTAGDYLLPVLLPSQQLLPGQRISVGLEWVRGYFAPSIFYKTKVLLGMPTK